MAKNGFKAMDSDMHVMEPCDLWQRYIDPRVCRSRAHRTITPQEISVAESTERSSRARWKHRVRPWTDSRAILKEKYTEEEARGFDNIAQLGAMDKEGLDVAILYPSRGLFVLAIDGLDPELAAAIAKAYNDWMHDFCKVAPDRMYGAAIVAPHDVSSAVEETRRVVKELDLEAS